ncbi:MAG TPA: CAP domain-containing protein [Acidimicrobiales bacterium]|nr:CAP domain-containing protein [Acidimicrobiales bacterium]
MLAAGLGLGVASGVIAAGSAHAAGCPAGSLQLGTSCIVLGFPTTTPPTTPPTTAAPLIELPPVTLPPVTLPPLLDSGVTKVVPSAAQRLLDLANGDRERAGLSRLTSRDDIVSIAVAHSQEMAAKGDIFHSTSFFGTAVKNLLNAAVRGENVAYNGDIDNTHVRLMASAGHRANILDARFSVVGIGVVQAADGRYFVTEDFIQPAGAPRPAAAAPSAAPRVAAPAASRKAPVPTTAAPPTTVAPAPTTVVPVTAAPPDTTPAVQLHTASNAASALPAPAHRPTPAVGAAAALLLAGAMAACCVVPRRRN